MTVNSRRILTEVENRYFLFPLRTSRTANATMKRTANKMTNSYGRSLDRTKAETFWLEIVVAAVVGVVGVDSVEVNVEELVTVDSDAVVCELI